MPIKAGRWCVVALLALAAVVGPTVSGSGQSLTDTWVTDGAVQTVATIGSTAYIGGFFTTVGPRTGGLVSFNSADGLPAASQFPQFGGFVYAIVPDGSGGFYVGGDLLGVGGVGTASLVHILPNLTLDTAWNPNPNFIVKALALSGPTLYVCGEFSAIGGQLRNAIGAVNVSDGLATPWNPNFGPMNQGIGCDSLSVVGATVFAGGGIRNVGGQPRNGFVALDATTGQVKFPSLTVDVNGFVHSQIVVGTDIYVGGEFRTIGGQNRVGLAKIDGLTGAVLAFNPNPPDGGQLSDYVYGMSLSGSTLYIGGLFDVTFGSGPAPKFGGQNRMHLAAVDITGNGGIGTVTAWNPGANGYVQAVAVAGSTVYAAGGFRNFGGQPRNRLAAASTAGTGAVTAWNPNANDAGSTLLVAGSTLHVGGRFSSLGGVVRNNLAAINLINGQATAWDPQMACNLCNAFITEIVASGSSTLYVAGGFTTIGGQPRNNLAALDATTGNAMAWAPVVSGVSSGSRAVNDLELSGSTMYLAGNFTTVNGTSRPRLAAVDATTGALQPFDASLTTNNDAQRIRVGNGVLYVGGFFTNIGGQPRNRLAALNPATGVATGWNPNAAGFPTVSAIEVAGNTVYVGGDFTTIGGQPRNYLVALDATTGLATAFDPGPSFRVDGVVVFNNIIYIRGPFKSVGTYPRHNIAAIDSISGNVTAWNAEINPTRIVYNMAIASVAPSSLVCVAGDFFGALRQAQRSFAVMSPSGTAAGPRIRHATFSDPTTPPFQTQTVTIGTPTAPLPFRIGDDDTPVASLTLTGTSSYKQLVPDANIVFGGTGETRTVTVTPAPGQSGVTDITITVSDGLATASATFSVIVQGNPTPNTPPTISSIANQTTTPGTPKGPIPFTVGDSQTTPASLTLTGTSSNTALLLNNLIVFGGSGANRTVTLNPTAGQSGTTTVTITVIDAGNLTASTTFTLAVGVVGNTPPTISSIANQTTTPGTPKGPIPFTVGDSETTPAALTVTGASSNPTLLPNANIVFGGSGASRTVTVTPAASQTGTATITVTVSDGALTAVTSFTLTVSGPGNAPPTISDTFDQITPPNTPLGPLTFTVGDAETAAGSLTVSVATSNPAVIPVAGAVLGGAGASRTITITPAVGQSGNSTITITVSDGTLSASDTFVVTVKTISLSGPFYMSEGATGNFFDLYVALANPNNVPAPLQLTFLRETGLPVVGTLTLDPMQRVNVLVDLIQGLEDTALSTQVESLNKLPVMVERTMFWDENTYYGGHGEKAGLGGDTSWVFAEGSQGFFDTFLLLANPNTTNTTATVRFLTEFSGVVERTYTLLPKTRQTVWTRQIPELQNKSFGMTVAFSQPAVAERAMYFGARRFWDGGHSSAGANAPATRWFHAEGATGAFFDTYILIANPNDGTATVTFTYFLIGGSVITKTATIAPNSRLTVNVELQDPGLADVAVSTQVTSDLPVVSERSMYWRGNVSNWYEAHNSFGMTTLNTKWGLAEGAVGGGLGFETYILVNNPNAAAVDVTVTYLRFSGGPITKTYQVPGTSRYNIPVRDVVPELRDEIFGAIVEAPLPIAVERAMYWSALGEFWSGGTNATATPLR